MTAARPWHRRARVPNYDPFPVTATGAADVAVRGWDAVAAAVGAAGAGLVVVDCYPGVSAAEVGELVGRLRADVVLDVSTALLPPRQVERLVAPDLGDDPVFGFVTARTLPEFFDPTRVLRLREQVSADLSAGRRVVLAGVGAAHVAGRAEAYRVLVDLTRREATLRQRAGANPSLGADPAAGQPPAALYKRAFFVDWRVADAHKRAVLAAADLVVDVTGPHAPVAVPGAELRAALERVTHRPFRLVPYFDPAPWGGQWMRTVFGLDTDAPNLGWCFDCVPEENSIAVGFGAAVFETPASNLVDAHGPALLGPAVHDRFGGQFPIRFDLLDTVGGGNLSLQVHPLTGYIRERFGMTFTQDESYYLLDADDGATVNLALRSGVAVGEFLAALAAANAGGEPLDAERFVNRFPASRHDHFLIPAGTVHCSGAGSLVLEVSATPYIFTFKLWDWGRPGLDGRPRPVHLEHGRAVIDAGRDTEFARAELVNAVTPLDAGPGWWAERTGLHQAEFIDTHRHWFTTPVRHDTANTVNVLNLVDGESATVSSPDGAFEDLEVHFGETFVVPAAVGPYLVSPGRAGEGGRWATLKAFVRGTGEPTA